VGLTFPVLTAGCTIKHIVFDEKLGWDHRPYFSYLDSVKSSMPVALYEFAANVNHHNLTSDVSLHDAWLQNISITEVVDTIHRNNKRIDVMTCYLGPFHNLRIHICYQHVFAYKLRGPSDSAQACSPNKSHGDLLMHEVRVASEDLYEHEIWFSSGAAFIIQFRGFNHRIEPV
jgi:hypothetical protein